VAISNSDCLNTLLPSEYSDGHIAQNKKPKEVGTQCKLDEDPSGNVPSWFLLVEAAK
jgi:hypothetical protein